MFESQNLETITVLFAESRYYRGANWNVCVSVVFKICQHWALFPAGQESHRADLLLDHLDDASTLSLPTQCQSATSQSLLGPPSLHCLLLSCAVLTSQMHVAYLWHLLHSDFTARQILCYLDFLFTSRLSFFGGEGMQDHCISSEPTTMPSKWLIYLNTWLF